MFTTWIVQPIFNLLVFIYAILPGGDFGVAVIIFTVLVRIVLWPMLKKNLHQTRLMRQMQPEIKKIKARSKGDRQKESAMLMELYKEKGVNPLGSIGVLLVQLPILWGLFRGLRLLASDKQEIIDFSYSFIHGIGNMQAVVQNIDNFNEHLFGVVDLTRTAFGSGLYVPALIMAALAAIFQFIQSNQLMPKDPDAKGLRQILKGEANGKKADQAEINAAMGKNVRYFLPAITFFFAASVPGALALYWAVGSLVGTIQQKSVLSKDVEEMEQPKSDEKTSKPDAATNKPKRRRKRR